MYQNEKYPEDNRMSIKEGIKTGSEITFKSPIGDVGSLLWRRLPATLAAKELIRELITWIRKLSSGVRELSNWIRELTYWIRDLCNTP